MATTDSDVQQEIEEVIKNWDNLQHWASEAVKGANNWLVTLRNAEDEGIKPWSDPFASQQGSGDNEDDEEEELGETNGILSYAEGLTAITLTDEFAEEYGWKRLQGDLYAEDVKQIMGTVDEDKRQIPGILTGENEDPGYSPAPYLSRDLTNNFTDAVSFSTTVLMGAIDPNEEVLQEKLVDENNIKQALERNLDWLLENQIDTDEGAGWAWIGGSAEKYDKYEKNIKTHNYFTYSAVIALVDYYDGGLGSSSIPAIEEIRDQRKDEIEDALEKATEFLLNQWWKKGRGGNGWALPKRPAEPNAMASCYAIIALSYLDSKVSDEIEGVNINKDRVNEGMDYIWGHINWIQDDPDSTLWSEKEGYKCRLGNQMEEEYLDGSGPYLYLDTVYEFLNYGAGDIEALDADEEELREWADEFAKKILLKCWAGEKGFIDKGFRHLGLPEEARDNPYDNPTALYTTNVGIETFLTNVLWDPDEEETVIYEKADQDKETEKTKEQAAPTKQNNTTQTVQAGPKKKTVIVNLEGESESMSGNNYPDKIDNQLESIEKKVDHLSEGIEDSSELDQNDLEEIRRRNRKFGDELGYLMQSLRETYEDWTAITDVLSTAQNSMVGSAGGDWDDDLKRINIEDFVRYIAKVYYCTDQETYEEIKMDEDDVKWLFVPQRKMVDEIEDWDNEKFADDDERKSMIEERVDELIEDPWGGKSMKQSVIEFEERYEEEVVNN